MDGENHGKPYEQMDDLGGKPHYFRKHLISEITTLKDISASDHPMLHPGGLVSEFPPPRLRGRGPDLTSGGRSGRRRDDACIYVDSYIYIYICIYTCIYIYVYITNDDVLITIQFFEGLNDFGEPYGPVLSEELNHHILCRRFSS